MTDSDLTKSDDIDDNRAQALSMAHRAAQFLQSKQVSGAVIIRTD